MPSTAVHIRPADENDVPLIHALIRELADYERLSHEVTATEELLKRSLFGSRPVAEVLIATVEDTPAGFALFFQNFSTFVARPGLYLEDLFVRPAYRGKGIGRKLLARLAMIARERQCGRVEWAVLDWNESAIGFYRTLGAKPMTDWRIYRLTGEALLNLAE
jgi:GNAT superfamily N-acetyltransferase